jgi:hypothetical protein
MAMLNEIGREKQRISERLARLDAERTKLSDQLNKLEMTERVLSRVGTNAGTTDGQRKRGPAKTRPAIAGERKARNGRHTPGVSLSDAALKAVQAHRDGASSDEVLKYLSRKFGMTVRANHLSGALQRHRRAGRLENRGQRWYPLPSAQKGHAKQSAATG